MRDSNSTRRRYPKNSSSSGIDNPQKKLIEIEKELEETYLELRKRRQESENFAEQKRQSENMEKKANWQKRAMQGDHIVAKMERELKIELDKHSKKMSLLRSKLAMSVLSDEEFFELRAKIEALSLERKQMKEEHAYKIQQKPPVDETRRKKIQHWEEEEKKHREMNLKFLESKKRSDQTIDELRISGSRLERQKRMLLDQLKRPNHRMAPRRENQGSQLEVEPYENNAKICEELIQHLTSLEPKKKLKFAEVQANQPKNVKSKNNKSWTVKEQPTNLTEPTLQHYDKIMKSFTKIGLQPPQYPSDIPATLEEIEKKKQFYDSGSFPKKEKQSRNVRTRGRMNPRERGGRGRGRGRGRGGRGGRGGREERDQRMRPHMQERGRGRGRSRGIGRNHTTFRTKVKEAPSSSSSSSFSSSSSSSSSSSRSGNVRPRRNTRKTTSRKKYVEISDKKQGTDTMQGNEGQMQSYKKESHKNESKPPTKKRLHQMDKAAPNVTTSTSSKAWIKKDSPQIFSD